jgi:hypothetical protein
VTDRMLGGLGPAERVALRDALVASRDALLDD